MTTSNDSPKVAGNANPRHRKPRRAERRLDERRMEYTRMTARSDFRAPEGAFHKPGSNKK